MGQFEMLPQYDEEARNAQEEGAAAVKDPTEMLASSK